MAVLELALFSVGVRDLADCDLVGSDEGRFASTRWALRTGAGSDLTLDVFELAFFLVGVRDLAGSGEGCCAATRRVLRTGAGSAFTLGVFAFNFFSVGGAVSVD